MKSKEEILNSYYSRGTDGMPEIAADGLGKAMEDYRLQAEEAAFNAARLKTEITGTWVHPSFADYRAGLIEPAPAEPAESQTIQFIADSILEQFLPNDQTAQTICFNIRTNGESFTVNYQKTEQGFWIFDHYTPADR